MNILIANNVGKGLPTIKSCIDEVWNDAVVYQASNLSEVITAVFDLEFDLLILSINLLENENLETFVGQAVKYTKVVVLAEEKQLTDRIEKLLQIGADAFLIESAPQEQILSMLRLLFS